MKFALSGQIFENYSNIKFHENLISGRRVVQCGKTDTKQLIIDFRNFVIVSKKILCLVDRVWNVTAHAQKPHFVFRAKRDESI